MANRIKTISSHQKHYTFLDYDVYPSLREIHKVKNQIKLSKKSFDILLVLINNHGRVVTKEELIECVWPNQIVTDAALNKQITRLRNELDGNQTTNQPIIETVRGVGIKLIPPVTHIETKNLDNSNRFNKKWLLLIPLITILALFLYTQYNNNNATNQAVMPSLGLKDTMVEIRSAMSINKKAFFSQVKRRNELGEMLDNRFNIDKDLSWERRFLKHHEQMNTAELFVFSQIRAYTEGPLLSSNQTVLDLLNSKKEIIDIIPSADKLRNHLIIWLNKYYKVFENNNKMSLLYVGVEDGAPYPTEVDQQVISWLEQRGSSDDSLLSVKQSINIALVPSQNTADWLNVGGLEYLSQKLQKHSELKAISPHKQWFDSKNPQALAIKMAQNVGLDFVLSISNVQNDNIFTTKLELRSNNGIQAKEEIQAKSLTVLFDKIDAWVLVQLKISTTILTGQVKGYQTTDYVLESYLRGREVAIHNSYEKAAQLFETAVTQDDSFLPAWFSLAEVEAKLGNTEKALALINSISTRENFNSNLVNKSMVLKAKFLTQLNKLAEANKLIDEVIALSEIKHDYISLIDAITLKVQAHFKTGTTGKHTIELLKKQIGLLKEHKPDTYTMALAYYNLASAYHVLGKIKPALKAVNSSIGFYTKDNNIRGVVIGNSLLARIYKDMGDTGLALSTLEQIEGLFEKIDGIDEQQIFLQYKVENLIYHGLRKEAFKTIKRLEMLNQKSSGLESKIVALALRFELNEIHKDYSAAKNNVRQMLVILSQESKAYPPIFKDLILAYDIFITALIEEPKEARLIVKKHLDSNPNISNFFEKELRMVKAIILAKENKNTQAVVIYHGLIKDYIEANQLQDALYYAGFPLLDIQWVNDKKDYVKTMNYLDELSIFKYPIHKYKAQHLAFNKNYMNAYVMMEDLKSKANEFWTTQDQILLEEYQELAQKN